MRGRVVSLTDYGAFVELEPGVEGSGACVRDVLDPRGPSSFARRVRWRSGRSRGVERRSGEPENLLGMKQTAPNPWDMIESQIPDRDADRRKGEEPDRFRRVRWLEEGIDGLIHISDMSWTKHIKHPSELFKKGQKVDAVVLRIDKEKERLSLGYKQLTRDPWEEQIPIKYQVGDSHNR